ncbi:MAG: ABC transporter permease [Candidatus Eisenbacteria sp.]|nr:ABC transporter permease [Candidatus Eisenbacteria bacterium]
MDFIWEGIRDAARMIGRLDREILLILWTSCKVSGGATLVACAIGLPAGFVLGLSDFPGRRILRTVLNSLMALPTVAVGLFLYALFTQRGPLGSMELLFTQPAMVVGQVVLATPIITALVTAAVEGIDRRIWPTALTLGAGPIRAGITVLGEVQLSVLAAVAAGFGRVIAEVGCAMMLGGNIKGATRTLTTAIAFETGKGEFSLGIALGIVLLGIVFLVNFVVQYFQARSG